MTVYMTLSCNLILFLYANADCGFICSSYVLRGFVVLHCGKVDARINVNVNVHVCSTDIPVGSADCTIYSPSTGTFSFTVSSPLGRIQHLSTFAAAIANHYKLAFSF